MADLIELNPELLLDQSRQMMGIYSSFDSLFNRIISDLNGINGSWSDMLSNNFTGKINSAQKSFMGSMNMLKLSSDSTMSVANSLLEVDQSNASRIGIVGTGVPPEIQTKLASAMMSVLGAVGGNISENMGSLQKMYGMYSNYKNDIYSNMSSSQRAALDKVISEMKKEYLGDNKIVADFGEKILEGDYLSAIEKLGDAGVNEFAKKYAKIMAPKIPADDIAKYTQYGLNVVKDGVSAVTEFVMDPSFKNFSNIAWGVTTKPILDTAGKDIADVVKLIPGVSEYYDEHGGTSIGSMTQTALGDFYGIVTGDEEVKDYVSNYYENAGGAFSGLYNGVADSFDFVKEQGGILNAASSFFKAALPDINSTGENIKSTIEIISDNGGFVSSILKGYKDLLND